MQDERHIHCQERAPRHPLSVVQSARLLVIADIRLDQEARRTSLNLRKILGHAHVLETLHDPQPAQVASVRSRSNETAYITNRAATLMSKSATTASESECIPRLEADHESGDTSSEESSSDDELDLDNDFDADHTLTQIPLHPPMPPSEAKNEFHDAACYVEMLGKTTMQKRETESMVTTNVVEVMEWDD